MSVREAVEREIEQIRRLDEDLADGVYAASALALADQMDSVNSKAVAVATAATELRQTMNTLRELMPEDDEKDFTDELRGRRDDRIARHAGSAGA